MTVKKHITALGKPFDMSALRAKNEKMRAVGNMNVNARGDIIDNNNEVVNDKNKRINTMYSKTMQNLPSLRRNQQTTTVKNNPVDKVDKVDEVSNTELTEFDEFNEPNPIKK